MSECVIKIWYEPVMPEYLKIWYDLVMSDYFKQDLAVRDLVLNVAESDNTDVSRRDKFKQEVLVEYLQKNVESMYPNIGKETYRVPDVHINKGKVIHS